jgi:hypothetical protein
VYGVSQNTRMHAHEWVMFRGEWVIEIIGGGDRIVEISAYLGLNWLLDRRTGVSRWMDAYRWIGEWMNIWGRVDGWIDAVGIGWVNT